ncbi:MAG: hypothetical protein EXR90_07860 [Methyloglobulus sp.]|nr:hypothetical protein [Methyloglobulus sp.]
MFTYLQPHYQPSSKATVKWTKTQAEGFCGVKLSIRKRELLKLIAEGHKNKEMADILCLSIKTIETHHCNLMRKLDSHNVAYLTVFANRSGMI